MREPGAADAEYPKPRSAGVVPAPEYGALRAQGPVRVRLAAGNHSWLLTRHKDVREGLAAPCTSADSSNPDLPRVGPLAAGPPAMSFLEMDDPEHARLRRMVTPEFTHRRVQGMRPAIEDEVNGLLDALGTRTPPLDLVAEYATAVPSRVISGLFGIPPEEREFIRATSEVLDSSTADPDDSARAFRELTDYLDRLVTDYEKSPADNVLGRLATRYAAAGELGHDELVAMARLLVVAGHDTTAQMIALSVLVLLRNPDQLEALRRDPELVRPAVDELLRYLSITQFAMVRAATADLEIGGVPIAAGEALEFSIPAANHDDTVYARPDRLDVTRDARGHLAFGHGVHQCLGRSLASLELEVALAGLFGRFPGLRLAVDFSELRFRGPDSFVFGVHELPVAW